MQKKSDILQTIFLQGDYDDVQRHLAFVYLHEIITKSLKGHGIRDDKKEKIIESIMGKVRESDKLR